MEPPSGSVGRALNRRHGRPGLFLPVLLVVLLQACTATTGHDRPNGTPSPPSPRGPAIVVAPADGATDVDPTRPVTVSTDGRLNQVVVTNPDGKEVAGHLLADGRHWASTEPLGYAKTYQVSATGRAPDGDVVAVTSRFRTFQPAAQALLAMNPLDGQTVGIGQPLVFAFDHPIADKNTVEAAIHITTDPVVQGAFYWFSDKEVHWRPREFWRPGTTITLDAQLYGKNLGNGVYGRNDARATVTVGDAVISRADGNTHLMTVEINGRIVRTIPVSLGKPKYPSNNGVHVVSEKFDTKVMDSTTFGLSYDDGGYRTAVKYATRISNDGEFVHAAPWSVREQGHSNVSHGCINMSTEAALWFFNLTKKGDIVIITHSGGPDLRPWDGWGDWQLPWSEWVRGGHK